MWRPFEPNFASLQLRRISQPWNKFRLLELLVGINVTTCCLDFKPGARRRDGHTLHGAGGVNRSSRVSVRELRTVNPHFHQLLIMIGVAARRCTSNSLLSCLSYWQGNVNSNFVLWFFELAHVSTLNFTVNSNPKPQEPCSAVCRLIWAWFASSGCRGDGSPLGHVGTGGFYFSGT